MSAVEQSKHFAIVIPKYNLNYYENCSYNVLKMFVLCAVS